MVEASTRAGTDLVEARLDRLDHLDEAVITRLALDLARPAIATLRPLREGGGFDGSEKTRDVLLRAACDAGFAIVDVERDATFRDALLQHARGTGTRVLVSLHDHAGTPHPDALVAFARRTREAGAWGAKAATTLRGPQDAVALVEAARRASRAGLRLAVMGLDDPVLRLVAPAIDAPLVYARAPDADAAAPGQVDADVLRRVHDRFPRTLPSGGTRMAVILGDPVSHSLSPAMQTAAFRALDLDVTYLPLPIPAETFRTAVDGLRSTGFLGGNVTAPHKRAALEVADEVTPAAERAGSANTLVHREGVLTAHTTDGEGAVAALREAGAELEGARALVLGAGGAARAVAHALQHAGAHLTVANRTLDRARKLAEAVEGIAVPLEEVGAAAGEAHLVLNCTSLGRADDRSPLPPDAIGPDHVVFDANYRTGGTPLVRAGRARGATVVPGEAMLLHQGALAFERWTDREAPLEVMRRIVSDHLEVSAWRIEP